MRRSFALILALALAGAARSEDWTVPETRNLTLHPAKPPTPALSIRLIPSPESKIPGDAAVFYHRALESLIEIRYREEVQAMKGAPAAIASQGMNASETSAMGWLQRSADEFPREEVRTLVSRRSRAMEEARLGTLRENCDWGFRGRDEGYSLLLPDIQETRSLSRWIALKARLDAEEGRIDEALAGLKTGLALARDVGRGEFYIQSLIAITSANATLDVVERIIQQPNCPNLYWALASLPRPFVDLSGPSAFEATMLEQEFPILRRLEGEAWSLETARACGDQFAAKLSTLTDGPAAQGPLSRPGIDDLHAHAVQLVMIAKDYRRAKDAAREAGVSAEQVEAMPMIQVVTLDSYRAYKAYRDEIHKLTHLPVWLGAKAWVRAEMNVPKPTSGFSFIPLVPAVRSAHVASDRLERRVAALMVAEAIRLYAVTHDGALPGRLEDLEDAPAPFDPTTGRPFEYKLEGDRAVLVSPVPAGWEHIPGFGLRCEFRISK